MTDETPWHDALSLPALLRHARNTYGVAMREALNAAGYDDIPGNGLYILGGLALGDGGVPIGQLCRDLRITKQAAGQLVDTLVLRGYLDRTTDDDDRRRLIVSLTARGRAAANAQTEGRKKVDAALLAAVGDEDVARTCRTLAALIVIGREDPNHG
ncbi:MarR family winged helix-turn-helix transcriptional regulator [Sphingomonas abietis]|uniref:MarR family winged helix-turn-helix transcriptional regulator n=1 Tax=Sphingomonas abietis TaxID=3012344 RepID=A0ABY7NHD1_9SPHN|nr:MarR family winged helix-turn-helix transcriptional regulator [Sphingomonas abietis]WBO20899.1 MarR family winged helix-turn-helix transcriptional regulator [Sphingomonas abietis]